MGDLKLLEVTLKSPDDFLKIMETLTRMGVTPKGENKRLYQSCHILHKKGKFYILHFKELFLLDGRKSDISELDIARRNKIANLLETWGLVEIVDNDIVNETKDTNVSLHVVKHSDKDEWELIHKYQVGKKFKK